MNEEQKIQTLRTIDKFDKLGRDGVVELLQKPASEFGANLLPFQAELIGKFLDCNGSSSRETLENLKGLFDVAKKARSRIDLMVLLDASSEPTSWDKILSAPTTKNDTWELGKRPSNIAYALDDILAALTGRPFAPSSKCSFEKLVSVLSD